MEKEPRQAWQLPIGDPGCNRLLAQGREFGLLEPALQLGQTL